MIMYRSIDVARREGCASVLRPVCVVCRGYTIAPLFFFCLIFWFRGARFSFSFSFRFSVFLSISSLDLRMLLCLDFVHRMVVGFFFLVFLRIRCVCDDCVWLAWNRTARGKEIYNKIWSNYGVAGGGIREDPAGAGCGSKYCSTSGLCEGAGGGKGGQAREYTSFWNIQDLTKLMLIGVATSRTSTPRKSMPLVMAAYSSATSADR